ncbi:MAG: pyruvate:ferredoxin (flavodoxin) oxidoreductase [Prevotella sp.]|nr:pyruvate:ferredoxin (flavodoxin) oxidoreductase [Prevotella sp.]MCM1074854.1 pyruvate:ferredoxin (flavodoxin) oxidoreductase [Ruminococcus sp.]
MNNTTKRITVDGSTAATYVAYAMSDLATVYPITPIASMGESACKWALQGRLNYASQPMQIKEMESELGAAGATHGALAAGALATTFTSSQGLMLMIPNMYKIAGELLPGVFHVGTRSVATHALSIFGDHSDVMACRATGFAFLASATVQETMDLALVAHLAALKGSIPVCHFFDGWRTANETDTIQAIDYDDMFSLIDREALARFRQRALNPAHPLLRGSAQNADVYFQNREASNPHYDTFPSVVQYYMDKVGELTGRRYHLFDYVGPEQADDAIVVMCSASEVIEQTLEVLNTQGYNGGVIKVRLYRPFSADALLQAIPAGVKRLAVLDRTKEPGSDGDPLFKDVATALCRAGRHIELFAGRYGLSSKEFDPAMVKAVFDNMRSNSPKREFTVGIDDDVTHRSLTVTPFEMPHPAKTIQAVFYGFASDGTVGATKHIAKVMASEFGLNAQAYFQYSAKKSGGYTISQLRLSPTPIKADYSIEQADYVACHKDSYVNKYSLAKTLRSEGVFVLNSAWNTPGLWKRHLAPALLRTLVEKKVRCFNVDAAAIAAKAGLGVRINMIMATAFIHLGVGEYDSRKALEGLQSEIKKMYIHEGQDVVNKNLDALAHVKSALTPIDLGSVQAGQPGNEDEGKSASAVNPMNLQSFVENIATPCNRLEGNDLPVSYFTPDGSMPMGTTAFEKRRIALDIPVWNPDKCIQCTLCSFVCAHAAIRPFLLDDIQMHDVPNGLATVPARGLPLGGKPLQWRIQVFSEDCTGCGSCAEVCPGHALTMTPSQGIMDVQIPYTKYCEEKVGYRPGLLPRFTVKGSQMYQPLLQFSGACAGCGETPYVKLLTQLFGERMVIANATGCSSIWGADYPANAYCTNAAGQGPAWANSLFEDNAEFGYGMAVALQSRRDALAVKMEKLTADPVIDPKLKDAMNSWITSLKADALSQSNAADALLPLLKNNSADTGVGEILAHADLLAPVSVWAIGGDGWAYDIGFAGLDHVLARRTKINMLVMDTECYSNTGGQMSKATPVSAVAKYAPGGKRTIKKDLGRMMMTYGNVYVAQIAMGANPAQAVNAMREAEEYPGPAIIIAYCPCINHGIRAGMGTAMIEERRAVKSGYWPLYRYNPLLAEQGKNPLIADSQAPDGSLPDFLSGESRYESLKERNANLADTLQSDLAARDKDVYTLLQKSEQ